MKPTDEQAAVVAAVAEAQGPSLMVNAYAGCAKSSTLELAAPGVRVPALALAFNRRIADELTPRLPGQFQVKTLNGLGHGAWCRALGAAKPKLDDRKLGRIASQLAKARRLELSSDQWTGVQELVQVAMRAGITPGNIGEPLTPDTPDTWLSLALDKCQLDQSDAEYLVELAHDVLVESIREAKAGVVSFDDQIYASVCLGGKFVQYPVVFVDEAQDLSPLQHQMLAKSLRADGRLVAVGDRKQAIYAFRGADSSSMDSMRGIRGQWLDLPLATTFRCPKAIVARQQAHVPGFRAWPSNAEGRVLQFQSIGCDDEPNVWGWSDVTSRMPPGGSLAILCRNNAPLLGMAFKLLRRGIGVVMLGRDIGRGLDALAKKIAPGDMTPIDVFLGRLREWEDHESALAQANGQDERLAGIGDRAECLRAVASGSGARNAGELRLHLARLFARESGQVTLSSIHRAKGLEWDCVLHLDPWRIPSKQARRAAAAGDGRALEQEMNLRYVAETRTRHTLLMADLEGFRS